MPQGYGCTYSVRELGSSHIGTGDTQRYDLSKLQDDSVQGARYVGTWGGATLTKRDSAKRFVQMLLNLNPTLLMKAANEVYSMGGRVAPSVFPVFAWSLISLV